MSRSPIATALAVSFFAFFATPAAHAQDKQDEPFAGFYAGPQVGAVEHHFYLEQSDGRTGRVLDAGYSREWAIGGGAIAGYDLPVGNILRLGAEVAAQVGGGSPEAFINGRRFQQNARYGYRATGKAGLLLTDRFIVFAKGGIGGDRFRIDNPAGVSNVREWRHSFVIAAGAQLRFSKEVELRLEYEHLDTSSHAVLIGLPIRFGGASR